jgi:hypothetical protein
MEGTQSVLLPLDGERAVSFTDRGHALTFIFRRITQAEWLKVFAGVCVEKQKDGEGQLLTLDFDSALVSMVEANLVRVEGYKAKDGVEITAIPNWQQRIRPGHKLLAGQLLQSVGVSDSDREYSFDSEHDEVVLDAAWGSSTPGKMTEYRGLIHRFKPATEQQYKRYYRALSESRVVGGSRTGRTIYGNRRTILIELYDDLIAEVDGYSIGGQPLASREQIVQEMDGLHKVISIAELFAAPDTTPKEETAAA